MKIDELLIDGAAFGLLVNAAGATPYGGLISAGDLKEWMPREVDDSAKVLAEVLSGIDPEAVVGKAYFDDRNRLKFLGGAVHWCEGNKPGLFGHPLPKGISFSVTKEKRGAGAQEYTAPIGRLSMTVDDEIISLDVGILPPKGVEYRDWAANAIALKKGDLITESNMGAWREPRLGGARVRLEELDPGVYQILEIAEEQRISKKGNEYWVHGLTLLSESGDEVSTWPQCMPKGCYIHPTLIRALEEGSEVWLSAFGAKPQTDKQGNVVYGPSNTPYMELDGRITFGKPVSRPALTSSAKLPAVLPADEPVAVNVEITDEQGNLIPF